MEDGISGGLQHRHETCCKKDGCHGRQTCMVQRWFHCGDVIPDRRTCIWQYFPFRTEPSKSYWVYSKFYWVYLRILWWYLGQQYINRKGSFSLLFLYHYIFPCLLQHFTKQCRGSRKAAARDAVKTWGGAVAPSPTGGSSEVTLGWACSSES